MESAKLASLLRACSITSKSLRTAKLIHQKILTQGLLNNTHTHTLLLSKTLVECYLSFHLYPCAKLVFQSIQNPCTISLWNSLLTAYTKNHMYADALELYGRLLRYPHLGPDTYTYPSVLKACGALGALRIGRMIHNHLLKAGFVSDVVVASSLVPMYAKCSAFGCAVQVFDEMPERDVACWNAVISCYYQDGQAGKAMEMYDKMRGSGFEPNVVTITTVVSSCARLLDLERGRHIHEELIRNRVVLDSFVTCALVDMYGKCGCLDMAKEVFEQVPRKNVIAWNSMMAAYSVTGDSKSCIVLLRRMIDDGTSPSLITFSSILLACSRSVQLQHGKFIHAYMIRNCVEADIYIYSFLADLYFVCGSTWSAEKVFGKMPKANVVSWNVMISGYVKVGNYFEALGIFEEMKEAGVRPNAITVTSILSACSQLTALEKGKEIHRTVVDSELETNEIVMGSLLDMYAKCGAVDEARSVFNKLPSRDLVSWTSMITAYGSHGQAKEALKVFKEMQQSNAKPDGVTLLAVLSACSHAGLVDEGHRYFNKMISIYGIEPRIEHYSCLIDLLGRAGRLNEAYQIIQRTPQTMEDVDLLSTLLSACLLHRDQDLGLNIAKLLIEKNPDDPSTYIMLSHSLASGNKWNEMGKVRLKMKEMGLRKNPGCSWIEINKKIQSFFVQDKSHPESEIIYQCLKLLKTHMDGDVVISH
ncbi:pentatricopeptide repeat-containing protein At5g27110 [Argentina anserina]|uniref:pentatricopeptide repeat-containing protein At5g27110 n=1 Tax=Argentina anserina TaxID=57926 RepID=UPI00217629DE|nr:pentatricopeptide repeat-containing protein At5g27110 [Potentilla anserina]XP_050369749.1 pentatricopeptide repeat-containing protein At5g27110 [Potentilla anserina]XP_050369751.1 pentatricopeptide repeat-containing protein At5g27110 [Potentilla anserina]XP_050369752.1 pentatricopeptide repeat-containing protein At5g27110 [Potentilla anserina]XP_050369753.1 pentatricopeptide repeat-containing protein At5g27110 [Potentilla anserina]XP_050369754.1 pentatricopeptide repeat-containing protein A